MPKPTPDLLQRMRIPWGALTLGVAGGVLMGRESEPIFRIFGFLLACIGAGRLALAMHRYRSDLARLLAAIPLADRSDALFRSLPKAWAALERDNLALRTQVEAGDQIRRQILARLKAGVVLLGQDRRLRLANPAAQVLLGASSNLALGESLAAAFREPESLRNLEAAFQGSAVEWQLKRAPRTLGLRAIPFPDPGQPDQEPWVLVILDDLTRQEALETTRQKFISNASHELRTPVTAIRVAVENLQDGELVLPEGDPNLRVMLRSVERMVMLLDDISELSRIETGALRLEPRSLRLGAFLAELEETVLAQARARRIQLRIEIADGQEELEFQADPLRLGQLLENLLSNAIKFSPAGSQVEVRAHCQSGGLTWTITDQGPGIAASDAQRIFERFYRAPSARAVPGTGLGLAIVKHLAVLMEGELALASEPGHGASFSFRLPVAAAVPAGVAG